MLGFLKKEANRALTENGAVTYATTCSCCLDLFATIGALRRESELGIIVRFDMAWAENADLAMKTLFFARDVRGGLGERRVFRVILRHIGNTYAASAAKNIEYIAEYGRFDDLLALLGTRCEAETLAYISKQCQADLLALENGGAVSLLGKWLPSVNATSQETVLMGKRIARALGMNDKQYRKSLSRLRSAIAILENNLRVRDYSFDYAKQPAKAMFKYRKAFARNDSNRYAAYLQAVSKGEAKLNTSTLLPYEIIAPFFKNQVTKEERRSIDVTWKAQADFTGGENALVVVDGSGSMYGGADPLPASVAISLGLYFAERNSGVFHNHFSTFSRNPQLVEIQGADILERAKHCAGFNEVANTDLQRVFALILSTAIKNRLPQSELPATLYIISDMEFDCCTDNAETVNFENAKKAFARYGYALPRVVFWNVASRNRQQPVTMNEQGVALVSGASPRVFSLLQSGALTPMAFMLETLQARRYANITA
jgi:hypothetical protein